MDRMRSPWVRSVRQTAKEKFEANLELTKTGRLVPRSMTSVETLNSSAVTNVACEKMLDENVTQIVNVDKTMVTVHFRAVPMFCGLSRSPGPSQSTKLGSLDCGPWAFPSLSFSSSLPFWESETVAPVSRSSTRVCRLAPFTSCVDACGVVALELDLVTFSPAMCSASKPVSSAT